MPIYEYQCQSCGKRSELLQRMADPPLAVCPECGGEVKKLMSAPAVQFKGSGWYVTDYAGKKSGGGEGKGEGKADSKPKEGGSKESGSSEKASSTPAPASSSGSSGSSGSD